MMSLLGCLVITEGYIVAYLATNLQKESYTINFETKQYEESIVEQSFFRLRNGVNAFMNETHFKRITMILRSAGFVTSKLIGGRNAINFAYIIYLRGRAEKMPPGDLEQLVRRWYVMAILRGRYTGAPETAFDLDIRQIEAHGLQNYADSVITAELPDSFWTGMLPQLMETSSSNSPYFLAYQAAQVKLGDKGFLSRDISVHDLVLNRSDVHHIYPRNHLKKQGLSRGRYNQIANFVLAQSEINIAIGDKPPKEYMSELSKQVTGGKRIYGLITDDAEMRENLHMNCIPASMLHEHVPDYEEFLRVRRGLMAQRIKAWFESL